jgi:hypothetical protein
MNRGNWVVCEGGTRWAAALRVAAARLATATWPTPRLCEARSLAELSECFDNQPHSYGLVEVHPANLGSVLAWLSGAVRRYPHGCFAALLDNSLVRAREREALSNGADRQELVLSLLEAGVIDVADSPRHLHHILALGLRHLTCIGELAESVSGRPSLVQWAHSLVPWQES